MGMVLVIQGGGFPTDQLSGPHGQVRNASAETASGAFWEAMSIGAETILCLRYDEEFITDLVEKAQRHGVRVLVPVFGAPEGALKLGFCELGKKDDRYFSNPIRGLLECTDLRDGDDPGHRDPEVDAEAHEAALEANPRRKGHGIDRRAGP